MPNECDVYSQSYVAGADLSAKQYLAVKLTAANTVGVAAAGEKAIGVLQNKPTSGLAAAVREIGRTKLVVDGNAAAIAAGDFLKSDALGKGVKTTTDKDFVFARAEEASTVAGDIIEVTVFTGFYLSV